MKTTTFLPADLLLPQNCDMTRWSVVASDQYTSQEEYWQRVENYVGRLPSTLRLTLPESCLDGPNIETDIMAVNSVMSEYLRGDMFRHCDNAMIYVERRLENGQIRKGIVGKIDLEAYDYTPTATSPVRGAEWTVLPRIPPRVAARKNAPLEVSHVVLLADDHQNLIFDGINKENLEKTYDFSLMEEGGDVTGWLLGEEEQRKILEQVELFAKPEYFEKKYNTSAPLLQFALGDGNHTLATAKECYERQKKFAHQEEWETMPSRYAMVELVNLHDEGVTLQPIHRVIHHVDPQNFLREFRLWVEELPENPLESQDFTFHFGENTGVMTVKNPVTPVEISTLQPFMDLYITKNPKVVLDYEQSKEEALKKSKKANTLCFILSDFNKKDLFPTLIEKGLLPRKTFSLGAPHHKRFYLEARKIR